MDLVDVSHVSPALFALGAVSILLIGSFLSLGVLRLFQLRKRQGFIYLALSVICLVALIWILNTWFV